MNKKIIIMVAAVIVSGGLGFLAGDKIGIQSSNSRKQNQAGNFQNNRGTGQIGSAMGSRGINGGMVSGEILNVDGQSVTVKLQNGGSKIVLISDNTNVMKSVPTDKNDIKTGENVTIIGKTNNDGSVSADSIQIHPATAPKK